MAFLTANYSNYTADGFFYGELLELYECYAGQLLANYPNRDDNGDNLQSNGMVLNSLNSLNSLNYKKKKKKFTSIVVFRFFATFL